MKKCEPIEDIIGESEFDQNVENYDLDLLERMVSNKYFQATAAILATTASVTLLLSLDYGQQHLPVGPEGRYGFGTGLIDGLLILPKALLGGGDAITSTPNTGLGYGLGIYGGFLLQGLGLIKCFTGSEDDHMDEH